MSSRISFHHNLHAVTNETADEEQRQKKALHVRKDFECNKNANYGNLVEAKTVTRKLSR